MDPAAMPRSSKAVRKAVRHALGDAEDCTMNDGPDLRSSAFHVKAVVVVVVAVVVVDVVSRRS